MLIAIAPPPPPNNHLQCFGLLGVNGAGKTTTFRMLTGDTAATGGDAVIASHPISESMGPIQQSFGYCPQVDALTDPLTGRQHLILYCKLRGLPPAEVRREREREIHEKLQILVSIDHWDSLVHKIPESVHEIRKY